MGTAGLTGAGAGGSAIFCGGAGGASVLQPASHTASMHAPQTKCKDFRKWAMA
jgi:hypothetical protein